MHVPVAHPCQASLPPVAQNLFLLRIFGKMMVLAGNSLKRFSLLHTPFYLSYIKETLIPHYAPPNNIHKAAPNSSSLPLLPTPLRDVFPDPPDTGTADRSGVPRAGFKSLLIALNFSSIYLHP